jgi:aminoglycoside/choline kinase family phosphotransferase
MKQLLKSKLPHSLKIMRVRSEASLRVFFRVLFKKYSLIAMVYSQENTEEINRIVELTALYKKNGICVPAIKDILENRIVLVEDLGDLLIQKVFRSLKFADRKKMLMDIARVVIKLSKIKYKDRDRVLDNARLKWEMDFFIKNFALNFFPSSFSQKELHKELYNLVDSINEIIIFAHRDFHSRNMLFHNNKVCLVDFQDSQFGPLYYDLVSFAFDSYLDLKSQRKIFLQMFDRMNFKMDYDQIYLTALQRNIKALGTFGYQVMEKKNLMYKKYIPRTIRHILGNRMIEYCLSYCSDLFRLF